ncbi:MAG: glycerol-3-phosphate 1-O-acyltransferase PlsY [Clostridiaceae bacterium]|nr:glycerol-3-phosphate 1-O-acyltransferase PlsY [Clostridiales bacterium]MDD6878016.1 glycerol-3-phosphate 1-O-acyltransferase PlsY [Clostridiaceae bacterium]MDY3071360.1 glycerol-3-phosphate 1-O-acyltransferase PlsY [Eubacteriales bacterium]MDY3285923.1 glycerol-3-phosphate 1-O-acyltransferase PlsY [Eubacteriales bacterium]MDY5016463.1 glycerol-3-phosphate 1-O-acyltransferase PlsY [Eubacteriales bacterium]
MDIPNFWKFVIIALASYLLGSVNSAVIVSRAFMKKDLRTMGSGNAGTTNALRVMGTGPAAFVFLGDILKGIAAALIGSWMGKDGEMIAAFFVILGHAYPVFFGFRGGKGILTTAAVLLIFDWRIFLMVLYIFIVVVALSHIVSLGSVTAAALMPVLMLIFHPSPWWYTVVAVVLCGGIILLHRKNIVRLVQGTESRSSFKKKTK